MTDALATLPRVIAAVAPHADANAWTAALTAPMRSAGLVTPNRIAMFIGQVAEESQYFEHLSEDLYYTNAAHIKEVWPRHFADVSEASKFIGRPAALANHVYANRMGNSDEESGDGWRFRGRGLLQITGKTLYQMFAKVEPRATITDWLMTPPGAAAAACWYWALPGAQPSLNILADNWDVSAVSTRINGGDAGAAQRLASCSSARSCFAVPSAPVVSEADLLDQLYNPEIPT